MAIVVLKVIALIFQRIERLIFSLPPRSSTAHELIDVPLAHAQVRHPAAVLDLVRAYFPILDAMDSHGRSRGMERHLVDKAKPMHHTRGAVMPLIKGHALACLSSLHLLEQRGMSAFFHSENIVATGLMQGLDVGGIGTQTVFGDDEFEMRVVLP